jgi:glycosyltransferase involved in cell wall biosynthesis
MADLPVVRVVIPALNEENAIAAVLAEIPVGVVKEVVVVDNGSTDATAYRAKKAGATVLSEQRRGYGYACLRGMQHIEKSDEKTDIVVFLDADHSDFPAEIGVVIEPITAGRADLVIGSRVLGAREPGSMTLPQRFGNALATFLIRRLYGVSFTDLGPFRAISWAHLKQLDMQDKTYGWTVEMQVKAAAMELRCVEVPVSYRKRIGQSKVSGTAKGVIMAGYKIIWTILKYSRLL